MLELKFDPFPDLYTERLHLRRVTSKDAQNFFELRSDPGVMKFIDRPVALTIDDALELIGKFETGINENEAISWGISLRNSSELIGTIGFWRIEKNNYRAEIGYLLHPDFQGRGLMKEAMEKVIGYGFTTMMLHSIEANVNPANESSMKLLEKTGFKREAYFRENYFFDGRFLDSAVYSLLTCIKQDV